jgi:hypothetical protein
MKKVSVSHPSRTYADVSAAVLQVRRWESSNLCLQQSTLALDLLVLIAHHSFHSLPLSCKGCYSSLNFSDVAIRKQLLRYVNEGWIHIEQCRDDRRVRWVKALPKLTAAMNEYAAVLSNALGVMEQGTNDD